MASSYSPILRTELIGSGEQSNSWGDTTNNNFSRVFDEAISGVYSKNLSATGASYTLAIADGPVVAASNEVRQAAIRFHGHTTARTVVQPQNSASTAAYQKIYIIINDGTASGSVTLQINGGNSSDTIPAGGRAVLATDGTNWYTIIGPNSGGGASTVTSVSAATFTAIAGQRLLLDTTSNTITVTLPAPGASTIGDQIGFLDTTDKFGTNALTINPNGGKVFGDTANGTVSTNGAGFTLIFTGTPGWKLLDK